MSLVGGPRLFQRRLKPNYTAENLDIAPSFIFVCNARAFTVTYVHDAVSRHHLCHEEACSTGEDVTVKRN
jgi:hypothetical protein